MTQQILVSACRWGTLLGLCGLAACAGNPREAPLPHYLCEQNTQFTARFEGDSVRLDANRGYELLFKKSGDAPGSFESPRMSVQFNLGANGKEAVLRYPLLPLVLRCVRTN